MDRRVVLGVTTLPPDFLMSLFNEDEDEEGEEEEDDNDEGEEVSFVFSLLVPLPSSFSPSSSSISLLDIFLDDIFFCLVGGGWKVERKVTR